MNRKETMYITFLLTMLFFIMTGLWAIDVSVSVMSNPQLDVVMTNGYWVRSPIQHYHVGLYLVGMPAFAVMLVSAYMMLDKKERK